MNRYILEQLARQRDEVLRARQARRSALGLPPERPSPARRLATSLAGLRRRRAPRPSRAPASPEPTATGPVTGA